MFEEHACGLAVASCHGNGVPRASRPVETGCRHDGAFFYPMNHGPTDHRRVDGDGPSNRAGPRHRGDRQRPLPQSLRCGRRDPARGARCATCPSSRSVFRWRRRYGARQSDFFDSYDGVRDGAFLWQLDIHRGRDLDDSFAVQCKCFPEVGAEPERCFPWPRSRIRRRASHHGGVADNYFTNMQLTGTIDEAIQAAFEAIPGNSFFG
jgi:hypothetical protein